MAQLKDTTIEGTLQVTSGSITGSLYGTASYAETLTNMNISQFTNDSGFSSGGSTSLTQITSSTTLTTDSSILVDATQGDINITLPEISGSKKNIFVKKVDSSSNVVNILTDLQNLVYSEQTYFSGSPSTTVDSEDFFGNSVCVNGTGTRIAVGAVYDELSGSASTSTGLVFIYDKQGSSWTLTATISGSNATDTNDNFGHKLDFNTQGDMLVVSALVDEISTSNYGLVYVFKSGSSGWVEQQILTGSQTQSSGDAFGSAVAINSDGTVIAVGAQSDEIDGQFSNSGVLYIFRSGSSGWSEENKFRGSSATSTDYFGCDVDINSAGTVIIVGAFNDELPNPTLYSSQGAAYIYTSSSSGWSETGALKPTTTTESFKYFGERVSINSSGNRVAIFARSDEIVPPYVYNYGVVHIFDSGSSGWTTTGLLTGSKSQQPGDRFGSDVSLNSSGDVVAIGSIYSQETTYLTEYGISYIFKSSSSGWQEKQYFTGSRSTDIGTYYEQHGYSISITDDGYLFVVGAPYGDSVSTNDTGLAYLYQTFPNYIENEGSSSISLLTKNQSISLTDDEQNTWYINNSHEPTHYLKNQQFIEITGQYGQLSNTNSVYILSGSSSGGVTLPSAANNKGLVIRLFRIDEDSNLTIGVSASAGETIGGTSTPKTIMVNMGGQYGFYTFISLGQYGWAMA